MSKKTTIEEFKIATEKRGYLLVSDEYIDNKTKLTIKDNIGYLYSVAFTSLHKRKTEFSKFDVSNIHTIDNIKHFLKLNHPDFELITDEYTQCSQPLILQTKEKYKCTITTSMLIKGVKPMIFMPNNPYIIDNIKILLSFNLPNFELLSDTYENKYDNLILKDNEGYLYVSYLKVIRENSIPSRFNISNPYTIDNIKKWLLLNNKKLELLSTDYKRMNKPLKFKCLDSDCNNIFETKFAYLLYANTECPYCVARINGHSKGETKILNTLEIYDIKYIQEYRFDDCRNIYTLPFDFHLPEYNVNIEFQGKQHYDAVEYFGGEEQLKKQQSYDQIKREYCIKNNIKLIEIPYWDFDNIEEILEKELQLKK